MQNIPIKTSEEIASMRQGGKILRQILDAVEKAIVPGASTMELNEIAENIIKQHKVQASFKGFGASSVREGYPAALCVSVNEEVVHAIPGERIIQSGDIVSIDCGVFFQGFHTDSARTIIAGSVSNEVKHFVHTTQKALQKAINKVCEGARLGDISAVIQKTIEQQGYAVVKSCTGHGVGKELHEPPEILNYGKKGQGHILKAGMTLAIEPIAVMGSSGDTYDEADGWTVKTVTGDISAHFEHTVLVTQKGFEILT